MKLVEFKANGYHCTDIDCSASSAVKDAWFTIDGEVAWFQVTYTSGAHWAYKVPVGVDLLAGLGMESVGRFVNSVLKPNAIVAYGS